MRFVSVESIEAFYKKMLDIIGAEPGDIRFSARDIVSNLDNIPIAPHFGEWISVEDYVPGPADGEEGVSDDMLVRVEMDKRYEYFEVAIYLFPEEKWLTPRQDVIEDEHCKVTHWMPLPEVPEKEEEKKDDTSLHHTIYR